MTDFAPLGLYDWIGIFGALLYICNYTRLVLQRVNVEQPNYFVVNLVAASLVLLSLSQSFNPGASVIQFFFFCMSVYGIFSRLHPLRRLRRRRRPKPVQPVQWHCKAAETTRRPLPVAPLAAANTVESHPPGRLRISR